MLLPHRHPYEGSRAVGAGFDVITRADVEAREGVVLIDFALTPGMASTSEEESRALGVALLTRVARPNIPAERSSSLVHSWFQQSFALVEPWLRLPP
jgi:hypothetical protein